MSCASASFGEGNAVAGSLAAQSARGRTVLSHIGALKSHGKLFTLRFGLLRVRPTRRDKPALHDGSLEQPYGRWSDDVKSDALTAR